MRNINYSVKLFEFGSVVQEGMSFKRVIIWSSGSPPVCWSTTIYAILKEGIMESNHVKLYELGPVVQEEMSFKDIIIWSSGSPFVQWTGTICAILVAGTIRNNPAKLF